VSTREGRQLSLAMGTECDQAATTAHYKAMSPRCCLHLISIRLADRLHERLLLTETTSLSSVYSESVAPLSAQQAPSGEGGTQ
jgi:hypothetical protein